MTAILLLVLASIAVVSVVIVARAVAGARLTGAMRAYAARVEPAPPQNSAAFSAGPRTEVSNRHRPACPEGGVTSSLEEGVLTLAVPKAARERPRRVEDK